jgi:ArsR family transcriptional regulator, arsenate/arsenite/antimonite-responsive transcriptional repressor
MKAETVSTDSPTAAADRLQQLCCSPLLGDELAEPDAKFLARALKTLAEPVRLRILSRIRTAPGARATTTDLASHLGLTQPTVSHHLGALLEMGFLSRQREGRQTWYAVEPTSFESLQQLLDPSAAGPREADPQEA